MKKKLLIIGLVWPEPRSSAAGTRMLQLIELFQEQNFEITFVSSAQESDYSFDLTSLGIFCQKVALNDSSFDDFISQLNPNIVLFDRFVSEEQFGWRVSENCPNAIRILDTEDLHCLRYARQNAVKKGMNFNIEDILSEEKAFREITSIYRCDLSLMVSDFEMEVLQEFFKIDKQLLFYLPMFYKSETIFNPYESRKDFVFIGNFLHDPNYDAVLQLKTIWKQIRKELPNVNLNIYGAYTSQKAKQLHNEKEGFLIKGRAENAFEVLSNAKVLLAPLRFGAGIKGKLLETMVVGTPSLTTSIGAEGIAKSNDWNGFICDDLDVFYNVAIQLYQNEEIWNQKQYKGIEILNSKFDKNIYANDFQLWITNLIVELKNIRGKNFLGRLLAQNQFNSLKFMSKWIEEKNKK